jgi:hypothetical protein
VVQGGESGLRWAEDRMREALDVGEYPRSKSRLRCVTHTRSEYFRVGAQVHWSAAAEGIGSRKRTHLTAAPATW